MLVRTRKIIRIVCLSLLFILCEFPLGAEIQAETTPAAAFSLADEPAQVGEAGFRVEGRLVPRRFASLALRSNGRLEEVFVQAGEQVEAGQLLLRLGGGDDLLAGIAAAERDLLLAQQALEALFETAGLQKAQAERELAGAKKELATAEYHLGMLIRPASQLSIDQAYANMRLAENQLEKAKQELTRTANQFDDGKDPIWMFVSRKQVKLLLTVLERNVATAQKRYEDSIRKYQDLIAPPDEIDLAVAEADVAYAQARMADAEQKLASLIDGPDPKEIASAQARIRATETALEASKKALQELELRAPFDGTVVNVRAKAGEWVDISGPVVVLADLSAWIVETEDLTEIQVPELELVQAVTVNPEALPELALKGTIESIRRVSEIKQGDVTYTARILLDEFDPRLRWGMTVSVDFEK